MNDLKPWPTAALVVLGLFSLPIAIVTSCSAGVAVSASPAVPRVITFIFVWGVGSVTALLLFCWLCHSASRPPISLKSRTRHLLAVAGFVLLILAGPLFSLGAVEGIGLNGERSFGGLRFGLLLGGGAILAAGPIVGLFRWLQIRRYRRRAGQGSPN